MLSIADAVNTAKIKEFLSQRNLTHALSSLGLFSPQCGFKISRLLQLFDDVEATNELPTDVHLRISRPGTETVIRTIVKA